MSIRPLGDSKTGVETYGGLEGLEERLANMRLSIPEVFEMGSNEFQALYDKKFEETRTMSGNEMLARSADLMNLRNLRFNLEQQYKYDLIELAVSKQGAESVDVNALHAKGTADLANGVSMQEMLNLRKQVLSQCNSPEAKAWNEMHVREAESLMRGKLYHKTEEEKAVDKLFTATDNDLKSSGSFLQRFFNAIKKWLFGEKSLKDEAIPPTKTNSELKGQIDIDATKHELDKQIADAEKSESHPFKAPEAEQPRPDDTINPN
ncbi:MAG: hypothetical protein P1U32_01895 [Legionellaceae bacterium]|nr:hypothetical protein [Legionellaceae bacterium]